jgi:hypothetical protein
MTGFIAHLYNLLLDLTNHYVFPSPTSTAASRDSLNSQPTAHLNSGTRRFSTGLFFITTLHGPNRKHRFQYPYCCVVTDPLLRNGFFYRCVRVHFRGNLFTEPLQLFGLKASCHNMIKRVPRDSEPGKTAQTRTSSNLPDRHQENTRCSRMLFL